MLDAVLALNGLDTRVFDGSDVHATPHEPSDFITVPDAHLLFNGEFKRVGTNDLKIEGSDGKSFFIEDYFSNDKHKHLMSPEGALLTSNIVDALAGPLAPGQHAQAGSQPAASQAAVIGRVETASGSCTVVRNGVSVVLNAGDNVRKGDVVVTSTSSAVAIVFADGTTFSLSANARMVLDEFVYADGGSNNTATISLVQGTFSFLAGQVAKTGNMKVDTPVATMGIRGTAVKAEVSAFDGTTRFIVMDERDPNTGNVTTGSFELLNKTTGQVLATVNASSVSWVVAPSGPQQVTVTPAARSPDEIQQDFATVQQMLTIYNNFQNNPLQPPTDQQEKRGQIDQGTTGNSASAGGSGGVLTNPVNQQTNFTVTVASGTTGNQIAVGNVVPIGTATGAGAGTTGGTTSGNGSPVGGVTQPQTVTIITGSGIIVGTEGADIIYGSDGPDTITALQGNDQVFAGGGNDVIVAAHGEGNDFYDGGLGFDTIRFDSATTGVTFHLNASNAALGDGTPVKVSTADGAEIGHDEFVRFEKIVGSPGNDVFILHDLGEWELDGGAGIDIVRIDGALDLTAAAGGPFAYNIEVLDLNQNFANTIQLNAADVFTADPNGPLRILGGTTDVINLTSTYQVGGTGPEHIGTWQLVGTFVDPTADNSVGDPFNDHVTDGVVFDVYEFVSEGQVVATVYIQDGTQINVTPGQTNAVNDTAAITENQSIAVDVVANDAPGFDTTRTLLALGSATVSGPDGVSLGSPQVQIVDNQISIVPGTAFDALAEGQTAMITVPYTMQIGSGQVLNAVATITVTGTNDAPTTSAVTLAAIAEDSGARLITSAELLANASDVDGDSLTVSNLQITSGNGTLVNNNNGTWIYTPAANDDTSVSFSYTMNDGGPSGVAGSATLDITPVNDPPTTSAVTLAAIAEDSGARIITSAELLANASDVDGDSLTVGNLQIADGKGSLVSNGDGTWTYTPAANDDTSVSFSYTINDGGPSGVPGSATLDITPVNDPPTTSAVTLAAIAEDSGARIITSAELLANASDVDGDSLTVDNLQIADGKGSLVSNGDGTWTYTPAANDDTSVSFSYTINDGGPSGVPGSATLDITPVNDPPTTSAVTLAAIAEDSGARIITSAELLANASDVDGDSLTVSNLQIADGKGSLVSNGDGTWTYTPAANDDTSVSFSYTINDGGPSGVPGSATLDITPVNDPPTTSAVTLAAIAEDSGARIITSAELLANASDVDGDSLTVSDLQIGSGYGTLIDNHDGTWSYTPAADDDTSVSFTYTISDGGPSGVAGSATLDITPVDEPISANDDFAGMTENQTLFVDVTANDATGANTSKTLSSLGAAQITGPDGVTLGTPAIVIENNQIRVTPGTAFDSLAEGETATIEVPYTVHLGTGENLTATAIITVTGTNDAPHFSTLPEGYQTIGTVNPEKSFGGVEAVQITTEGASRTQVEDFLGLDHGTLSAVDSQTTDGAAIAFDLDLHQGETVTFSWNFASTEYEPYNDYAFFSVSSDDTVVKLSDIYTIGDNVNDNYLHSSGWQQFTYTATADGDYRFGIGTMNTIDNAFDSSLYISGFSGLGFHRETTESGNVETFDLLNGATDPDTHDVLTATNVVVLATDQAGNVVDVTGAYTLVNNELSFDPHQFEYLGDGQSVTIVATYDVSDGHVVMHNSATLVIDGEGEAEQPNSLPVANVVEASGDEDAYSPIAITLTGNDSDGDITGFKLLSLPEHGWLYSNLSASPIDADHLADVLSAYGGSKTLYFKPDANWNGETDFQFVAIDDHNAQSADPATATVTVNPVNDAPGANDIGVSTSADNPSIPVMLSGSDIDGAIAGFQLSSLPEHGTLYVDAEHLSAVTTEATYQADAEGHVTFYFVPDAEWPLETIFEFIAYDDLGAPSTSPGHVTITAAANDVATLNVETDAGFSTDSLVLPLLNSDVTEIAPDHIDLVNYGDGPGVNDDTVYHITTDGLVWTETSPGEFAFSAGTITGIEVSRINQNGSHVVATLTGLNIPAEDVTDAVHNYNVTGDPTEFAGLFQSYSYHAIGGDGPDVLTGGIQGDIIEGGGGSDILTGGAGSDHFVFLPGDGVEHDVITDMTLGDPLSNPNADVIDLEGFGYTDVSQLVISNNEAGDLRIMLSDDQWIELSGIPHTTQLTNQNFHFGVLA